MWEQLLINSKISIDSEIFYYWLKTLLTDIQSRITQEAMLHFFKEKICSDKVNFINLKRNGFECIQTMFLQINEYEDKLVLNHQQGFNNQNFGIGQGSIGSQANNNMKIDFKVHVHPSELEGVDVLWRMLEDVDKKN